ncbi:hypothetical protein ABZT02_36535 [Streptomyces sp. NPDC005402]|uniref:hypothetical protein n=1 Tax=Streptomyces sp. NPDC005402 TaxID=3155338 RepID=UPI0033B3B487
MTSSRGPVPHDPHPMFRAVFGGWHAKADVFSALPDAPVQPDDPQRQRWWRRLNVRRQKPTGGGSSLSRPTARPQGCPAPSGDGRR